jgi:hypothetical protein
MLTSYDIEEYEFINGVTGHLQIANVNPAIRVRVKEVMQELIVKLLYLTYMITQSESRMEASHKDFEYALNFWIRSLIPQKSYLLLNENYLDFVSSGPALEHMSDSDNDEDYQTEENESSSGESSDDEEEDIVFDECEDDNDSYGEFDLVDSLFETEVEDLDESSEDLFQGNDINNTPSPGITLPLVGPKLHRFRKYCIHLLFQETNNYPIFHDEIFVSLYKFLFEQFALSFRNSSQR